MIFGATEIDVLGHIITQATIKPSQVKIDEILKIGIPKTPKELQSILGSY